MHGVLLLGGAGRPETVEAAYGAVFHRFGQCRPALVYLPWSAFLDATDVPRYSFEYTVTPSENRWLLKGSLRQSEAGPDFIMPVPLYADFDGRLIQLGRMRMVGSRTEELSVLPPSKPRRVAINASSEVLCRDWRNASRARKPGYSAAPPAEGAASNDCSAR